MTNFVPKTINDFIKDIALIENASERMLKLTEFVKRLEDEMNKVDAFRRELPLCMLLLNDVIGRLKEEVVQCAALSDSKPSLEELVLLKKESDEEGGSDKNKNECMDKKSWIGSLKLSGNDSYDASDSRDEGCDKLTTGVLFKTSSNLIARGAFVPFKDLSGFSASVNGKEDKKELSVRVLSLVENRDLSVGANNSPGKAVSSYTGTLQPGVESQLPARKQRRCWSTELHRRFVIALEQLGGAQVATPKQIRELMQVDGLTNDEVKSHLQKYRLHTRRLPSATAFPANQPMGILRMSQDQYAESTKASIPHSGSPQGPLQLAGNSGGTSTAGDSMFDDEDEKSDSYNWKSHIYKHGKDDA